MTSMDFQSLISKDLSALNLLLERTLQESQNPKIQQIGQYLSQVKGKQVRASIVLLSYYAASEHLSEDSGAKRQNAITLGAAIESLHLASLVHDDIIDEAPLRRNKDTIYKKWGTKPAIVTGVYVYALTLKLISELNSIPILADISETVKNLCTGEYDQLLNRDDYNYSIDDYMQMIQNKTAVLFESSASNPVRLLCSDESLIDRFRQYGHGLGLLFQLTDDYLDLFGDGKNLAKLPGQDILSGEFTLPFFLVYHTLSDQEKSNLQTLISEKNPKAIEFLQSKLTDDIKTEMQAILNQQVEWCRDALSGIKISPYQQALSQILDLIAARYLATA